MGKLPAFLFYPSDWLGDPQLQMTSAATRGVWINLLCAMWWAPQRGQLTGSADELCKLANCNRADFDLFLMENSRHQFACVTNGNNGITLINRRMVREERARESNKYRQAQFRSRQTNKINNASVTFPSSVSVTVSDPKKEKDTVRQAARDVLSWLNTRANRNYRETETNLTLIVCRLKSGISADQLKAIVSRKVREWGPDAKMVKYLRPATLFNQTKCEQYLGELPRMEGTSDV